MDLAEYGDTVFFFSSCIFVHLCVSYLSGKINQHLNHVHNKNRPFPCDKCNYSAKTKFALNAHLKRCGQFSYKRGPGISTDILFVEKPQDTVFHGSMNTNKPGQVHVLEVCNVLVL